MGGVAVHAYAGQRHRYRPLQSPLCASAQPEDVMTGLLRLYPFRTVYLADLDALQGRSDQRGLVRKLAKAHPEVTLWLDAGLPVTDGPWVPVIGTESLDSCAWTHLQHRENDWILSLDFLDGHLQGASEVLIQPERWPTKVIVMTLSRVGSFAGPDWERLERVRSLAPGKEIIAAGGVRDARDLLILGAAGIDGALVASALHTGRLNEFLGKGERAS